MAAFVQVADGGEKGRILTAKRAFNAGATVLGDTAFVAASWDPDKCIECATDPTVADAHRHAHPSGSCPRLAGLGYYPPAVIANIEALEEDISACLSLGGASAEDDEMDESDPMDVLDKARCFIKCVLWSQQNETRRATVMEAFGNLTVSSQARDLAMARAVVALPSVVQTQLLPAQNTHPFYLSVTDVAHMIGVLNTNSHMLDLGGSALFLLGAMMESDCRPNSAFFTSAKGSRLSVVAMRPLAVGEPISIDYGNNLHRPTKERQEYFSNTYGFLCQCNSCTSLPDKCRAFYCPRPQCKAGIVMPIGRGDAEGFWRCYGGSCGEDSPLSPSEQKHLHNIEVELSQGVLDSEEACDEAVQKYRIHPTHHLIYWCMHALGEQSIEMATQLEPGEPRRAWLRVLEIAEQIIPNTPELVLMYDKLAQVECVSGNLKGAQEAWARAYELACTCSDMLTRRHIKRLRDSPPLTPEALRAVYAEQTLDR
jgi:hypothetical protein